MANITVLPVIGPEEDQHATVFYHQASASKCLRLPVELPLAVDDGKKDKVTRKHYCRECILITFSSVPSRIIR